MTISDGMVPTALGSKETEFLCCTVAAPWRHCGSTFVEGKCCHSAATMLVWHGLIGDSAIYCQLDASQKMPLRRRRDDRMR
ncbi:MAG: hypothetical protein SPJ13_07030 [Bacteroidales bacterium]|nr:hypothetical protein [Bacteroidales bacterium]